MSKRRKLAREKLEIYLVHLLLAYRRLLFIVGLSLVVYAVVNLFVQPSIGFASLVPAIFLLLLASSYKFTLYTARLGAWIGTLREHDD